MEIKNLPLELQNKIFYYYAEHPCARMIRKHIEITEEDEMKRYVCHPPNVSNEISFCSAGAFPGRCDHCNNNCRIIDGLWVCATGADVCRKCLNDDKIRELYADDFLPDY